MKFFQKIIPILVISTTLAQIVLPMEVFAQASGGGSILSRAATRTARIAVAQARLDAAVAALATPPGILVAGSGVLIVKDIGRETQEVAVAAKELADANTSVAEDILSVLERIALQTLKRQVLDVLVNQIVDWIQNGGEPRFVGDWNKFFANIANNATGEFIQNLAPFLCSPFSLQLRVGLLPVNKFGAASPYTCTLNSVIKNVNNFYSDFRNGGWIAYQEASRVQNNAYGALWLAWYGRDQFVASQLANANSKLLANKGFLSVQVCKKGGVKVPEGTPGAVCEDTTPGGFVGASLEKAVGVDFDFIINAQELGDYVAAIVNALINRVIKEGVNGIRTATGGKAQTSGYSSFGDLPAELRQSGSAYTAQNNALINKSDVINQLTYIYRNLTDAQIAMTDTLKLEQDYLIFLKAKLAASPLCQATINPKIDDEQVLISRMEDKISANDKKIRNLQNAITVLGTLTDNQYGARVAEFQALVISSDAAGSASLKSDATQQLTATPTSIQLRKDKLEGDLLKCK